MLNRRVTALLLAAAMALTLCGMSVFAADPAQGDGSAEPAGQSTETTETNVPAAPAESPAPEEQPVDEPEPEPEVIVPDAVGTVSFSNLSSRLRENNLTVLSLEETINSIKVIDYDKMTDDIRKQLNQIANTQWMLTVSGGSFASSMLQGSYDSLRDTFDDLKDGEIQKDNDAAIRQLENAQDQMVMASESLYVALVEMELNDQGLARQLTALDRAIQELELRYELGQVSALTLQQTKANRTALVSGRQTLEMNIANYKTQLELMIGAELSGNIQLQALPQVSSKDLSAMDLEKDLVTAKENSYDLFAAQRTLDDAKEDFKDAGKDNSYNENKYQYVSAKHTWEAAQYTYSATIQNFENSFRILYNQVKDYQQVLTAAKTALAVEQNNYAVDQLKYEQGTISKNTLLTAEDDLKAAQDKVNSAAIDLFTAYNNYRWAVDYGILN